MRDAYTDLVGAIEVGKEMKAGSADPICQRRRPELLHQNRTDDHLVLSAERRLAAGDRGRRAETGAEGAR